MCNIVIRNGVKAGLRTKYEAGGSNQNAVAFNWDTDIFSNYTIIKYRRSINVQVC